MVFPLTGSLLQRLEKASSSNNPVPALHRCTELFVAPTLMICEAAVVSDQGSGLLAVTLTCINLFLPTLDRKESRPS
jgi:hypothetical protein